MLSPDQWYESLESFKAKHWRNQPPNLLKRKPVQSKNLELKDFKEELKQLRLLSITAGTQHGETFNFIEKIIQASKFDSEMGVETSH
jgi:hypothetical protein